MTKAQLQERRDRILNGWSDVAVYWFGVLGVFTSGYLDPFLNQENVVFRVPPWGLVLFSLVLAWGLVFMFDARGFKKEGAREGRRNNWLERSARAVMVGMLCRLIIPIAIEKLFGLIL